MNERRDSENAVNIPGQVGPAAGNGERETGSGPDLELTPPAWPPAYGPPPYGPPVGHPYPAPPYAPEDGRPWPTPPTKERRRTGRILAAVFFALVVLAVTGIAIVVGHVVLGPSQPKAISSAPGAPSNAASVAASVAPALVDVNVIDTYQEVQGAGTGMVLSSHGEVLTNNHVIEGATSISVTDVGNGKIYSATVVGYDRTQDVAVLQLTGASGLKTVEFGNSSKVTLAEGVVAIGNAQGAGGTPSYSGGSVTALDQTITAEDQLSHSYEQLSGLIETNADVVPGDSGGALVDSARQVIGMVTAGSDGFQFQGPSSESYAIPINEASSVAKQIESRQASASVHIGATAFLGVEVGTPVSGVAGAEILGVVPSGPAAQAGLAAGDKITELDGHPVSSPSSLTDLLLAEKPGASVQVDYLDQSGQPHSVSVHLTSGPPQ